MRLRNCEVLVNADNHDTRLLFNNIFSKVATEARCSQGQEGPGCLQGQMKKTLLLVAVVAGALVVYSTPPIALDKWPAVATMEDISQ